MTDMLGRVADIRISQSFVTAAGFGGIVDKVPAKPSGGQCEVLLPGGQPLLLRDGEFELLDRR